jgi:hypothetical protein
MRPLRDLVHQAGMAGKDDASLNGKAFGIVHEEESLWHAQC